MYNVLYDKAFSSKNYIQWVGPPPLPSQLIIDSHA